MIVGKCVPIHWKEMIVFKLQCIITGESLLVKNCTGWVCVNLTQAGIITEKRASGEEMPSQDPAVRHFLN